MKRMQFLLAVGLAAMTLPVRAGVAFNDGDFSSWLFGYYVGEANVQRVATGCNPGACLSIATINNVTSYGSAIKSDWSTTAALADTAFTLTLDVLSGANAVGDGQALELLVEQGGSTYARFLGVTGVKGAFTSMVFQGTLAPASFRLVAGTGPATPNLSGGVVTRFGIAGGNSISGMTQYYDNVQLDLAAVGGTCGSFLDVGPADIFCDAAEWLKNRNITLGCSATGFCPNQVVTRAQMALFMNRLGKALAPEVLHDARAYQTPVLATDAFPGSLLCQTQDFSTGAYPRVARFLSSFHAYPDLQVISLQGYLRYSTNGGQSWNFVGNWMVNQFPTGAVADPGRVASGVVNAPPLNLAIGKTYRFGLFADSMGLNPGFRTIVCDLEVTVLTPP